MGPPVVRQTAPLALALLCVFLVACVPATAQVALPPLEDIAISLEPRGAELAVEHLAVPPTPAATFRISARDRVSGRPLIGLQVELALVLTASGGPSYTATTAGIVRGAGRTDAFGFLNMTELAFVTCGRHRLVARMTEADNVSSVEVTPQTNIVVNRRPSSCSGRLFEDVPTRATPRTTPLLYLVPGAVDTVVANAFAALHSYVTLQEYHVLTAATRRTAGNSRSVSQSETAERVRLSSASWEGSDFLWPLPTLFAVAVDSCGLILEDATVVAATATVAMPPELPRGSSPYGSPGGGFGNVPPSRWPRREVVPWRERLITGAIRTATQPASALLPVPTARIADLETTVHTVDAVNFTFFLPDARVDAASIDELSPDTRGASLPPTCDTFRADIAMAFPPVRGRTIPVSLAIATQGSNGADGGALTFTNEDLAKGNVDFTFSFERDVLPGLDTLAGQVSFTSSVSQELAPRGVLYAAGDQSGADSVAYMDAVPDDGAVGSAADATTERPVVRIGNVLYFPKRRRLLDDVGNSTTGNASVVVDFVVRILRNQNAYTLRQEVLTLSLDPRLMAANLNTTQSVWAIPVAPRIDPQGLPQRILSYIALFGRQLDLGAVAATMHVADCSLDRGLAINPALYPFSEPFDDSLLGFWRGALILNSVFVVLAVATEAFFFCFAESRFPHYALIVARMLHPATSLASFTLLPSDINSIFGYYVLFVIIFYSMVLPAVSAMILRAARVPWDENEFLAAFDDLEDIDSALAAARTNAEKNLIMRERRERKQKKMRAEVRRRLASGSGGNHAISGAVGAVKWSDHVKRLFKKRGTYSILCVDHERARTTFERYRGPMRYWGCADLVFYMLVGATSFFPCPLRAQLVLGLVSSHLAGMLFFNPYITVALNVMTQCLDVVLIAGTALVIRGEERAAQPLFDTALYGTILVNLIWLAIAALSSTTATIAVTTLYDALLERKRLHGDVPDRVLIFVTKVARKLQSVQHSRALDDDYCARRLEGIVAQEEHRRELETAFLAGKVDWPDGANPELFPTQPQLTAIIDPDGEVDAFGRPKNGRDVENVDVDAPEPIKMPETEGELKLLEMASKQSEARSRSHSRSESQASAISGRSGRSRRSNPASPRNRSGRATPSDSAGSRSGAASPAPHDPLADILRGPNAHVNPIHHAGYNTSGSPVGVTSAATSSVPATPGGRQHPQQRRQSRTIMTPDGMHVDAETGLREYGYSFLPASARAARRREAEARRAEEEARKMDEYSRAHFELFSNGRSIERMLKHDTENREFAPQRSFVYVPSRMLTDSGQTKVAAQNQQYCPPDRAKNEFVARVVITKDGVKPVYKSRERPFHERFAADAAAASGQHPQPSVSPPQHQGGEDVNFAEMTVLERRDYARAHRLREWREADDAAAGVEELPDSDGSIERQLAWRSNEEQSLAEKKFIRRRQRAGGSRARVRVVTTVERAEEKRYMEEHFKLHSGGRSATRVAPPKRQSATSRSLFYTKLDEAADRQRRRDLGQEVSSSDDSSDGPLGTASWETRAADRKKAREDAADASLPKLKKGRNFVREQLEARRARSASQNRAAVDRAGIDRDSAAYQML